MHFPFERANTYTVGALRAFERELSTKRQSDKQLSEVWRVPNSPDLMRWAKIREETYPIMLLADHKGYADEATFQLRPHGYRGIDADINTGTDRFSLQITIADPKWGEANGGRDHQLIMEQLNRPEPVIGSGGFRKSGDGIVATHPGTKNGDGVEACRKGLVAALTRKSRASTRSAQRLLIYARDYYIRVIDDGFQNVVRDALAEFERSYGAPAPFDAVYFVAEGAFDEA